MNKLKELKIVFESENDIEMISELIADCFYKNNVTGVVIESPVELTDEWGEDPVVSENFSVSGYINYLELEKIELIKKDVSDILNSFNVKLDFQTRDILEEDWSSSWKEFFYPVEISKNIVIKPTWRELEKDYKIIINIDPGMAFGSGSHATTSLCVKMIEETIEKNDKVLDIGCGSGILMIAAQKCGASFVTGIDNDVTAVEISKENMRLNKIDDSKFSVFTSNLLSCVNSKFDLITANILAEVIVELIPDLQSVSKENTRFIFSGIIEEKKDMVIKKMEEFKIKPEKIYNDNGWIAISGSY
ncbi:MAG: 50S ribosomal protein L11 methyltransferase [Desulforegulaceae bacterium]|nr:50S ribosomal protein L11 methyltransferase [Desulforegulaceae bacterium]